MTVNKKVLVLISFLILLGGCAALKFGLFDNKKLLFSHKEHIEQEIECELCHKNVIESKTVLDNNLPKEEDCLLCHERGESPEDCALCHSDPQSPKPLLARVPDLSFSHKRHSDAGVECKICHKTENPDISLPKWSECSECHEISEENCEFCHPKIGTKEFMPASHSAFWTSKLQVQVVQHDKQCEICHKRESGHKGLCSSCHREDIPRGDVHDTNYLHVHIVDAKSRRVDCGTCHQKDFCSSCHNKHEASFFEIHGKGWILDKSSPNFHGKSARRNLESCVSCHDGTSCIGCHSSVSPHPEGYRSRVSSEMAIQHRDPSVCLKCHEREDLCSRCHSYKD